MEAIFPPALPAMTEIVVLTIFAALQGLIVLTAYGLSVEARRQRRTRDRTAMVLIALAPVVILAISLPFNHLLRPSAGPSIARKLGLGANLACGALGAASIVFTIHRFISTEKETHSGLARTIVHGAASLLFLLLMLGEILLLPLLLLVAAIMLSGGPGP